MQITQSAFDPSGEVDSDVFGLKKKKSFSENFGCLLNNLATGSAFHLIRLQKPAVYSAAVTTKRWEAEPSAETPSEGRFTVSLLIFDISDTRDNYLRMQFDKNVKDVTGDDCILSQMCV